MGLNLQKVVLPRRLAVLQMRDSFGGTGDALVFMTGGGLISADHYTSQPIYGLHIVLLLPKLYFKKFSTCTCDINYSGDLFLLIFWFSAALQRDGIARQLTSRKAKQSYNFFFSVGIVTLMINQVQIDTYRGNEWSKPELSFLAH